MPAPTETAERPHSDRQAALLAAIVDVLLAQGVSDMSLRPLAEAVGTSARMLIYHFGSKENLLAQALAQVRGRMVQGIVDLGHEGPAPTLSMALARFWQWANESDNQPYFRLLFELDGLSMYGRIALPRPERQRGTMLWVDMVAALVARLHPDRAHLQADATLIAGVLAGLVQDRLSTGDHERTDAALARLLVHIDGHFPSHMS